MGRTNTYYNHQGAHVSKYAHSGRDGLIKLVEEDDSLGWRLVQLEADVGYKREDILVDIPVLFHELRTFAVPLRSRTHTWAGIGGGGDTSAEPDEGQTAADGEDRVKKEMMEKLKAFQLGPYGARGDASSKNMRSGGDTDDHGK